MRGRAGTVVAALALIMTATLAGCGTEEPDSAPQRTTFPADVAVHLDQSRFGRQGREVFVRLVNEGETPMTVLRAEISSPRFATVTWDDGPKEFGNQADLAFDLPTGRCGEGSDADVEIVYRRGDDPQERVSRVRAADQYGNIAAFLTRDCARQTLEEAADLAIGSPRVVGRGREARLRIPVTLTPTGRRDDVAFDGFEDTTLFRATGAWAGGADVALRPDGAPLRAVLQLSPGRCDPHALAEDKVGTLVPTLVRAPDLPDGAGAFYLPVDDATRSAMFDYWDLACGQPGA